MESVQPSGEAYGGGGVFFLSWVPYCFEFLKIFFYFMCFPTHIYTCYRVYAWCTHRPEEGDGSPGARVRENHVGTGYQSPTVPCSDSFSVLFSFVFQDKISLHTV